MHHLVELWLPILLSTLAVFVASSAIHMASPWHKGDYPRMANEDSVMDAMRPLHIPPGDYFFPRPQSMAEMKDPAFKAKQERGPVVLMTVFPNGGMQMGATMAQWCVYLLIVSLLTAATLVALPRETRPAVIFHQAALVSFGAYALALWQLSIWYRRSWTITMKSTVDAAIYAALTGWVFMWWWGR